MSWRVLEETKATVLDDGRPSFEVIVGWDVPSRSYFVLAQDNTGDTERRTGSEFFVRVGGAGALPDLDALVGVLHEFHTEGFIYWPPDAPLLYVLADDRIFDVTADDQESDAVARVRAELASR